jgi:hypothetical protein
MVMNANFVSMKQVADEYNFQLEKYLTHSFSSTSKAEVCLNLGKGYYVKFYKTSSRNSKIEIRYYYDQLQHVVRLSEFMKSQNKNRDNYNELMNVLTDMLSEKERIALHLDPWQDYRESAMKKINSDEKVREFYHRYFAD